MNILIADDEPLIHVSIQYTIQALNRPDVTVFNADNGREMLAELQRALETAKAANAHEETIATMTSR